ncbi:MAG: TSUP family transporter, partial [Acidimicrobiales bacterium]
MDLYIVLGSAVVGLLVGLTGAGGGALMTPMLVLVFSMKPSAAISSDLLAAVVMRPVAAAVHLRRRTVDLRLVALMSAGSVPAAFAGTYVLHLLGRGAAAEHDVGYALAAALLLGTAAMALRAALDRRSGTRRDGAVTVALRPGGTLVCGAVGGFVVGVTSIGAGSLMIVMLMFLYPA